MKFDFGMNKVNEEMKRMTNGAVEPAAAEAASKQPINEI